MDVSNNAFTPSIERIMKLAYFDGINQRMEAEDSSDMLQDLMKDDYYDYVLLMTKYFDKNNVVIEKGLKHMEDERIDHALITLLKSQDASEKWLIVYFDMFEKCNMSVPQDVLKKAFDLMDSIEQENEREKCKSILKRHLSKNVN